MHPWKEKNLVEEVVIFLGREMRRLKDQIAVDPKEDPLLKDLYSSFNTNNPGFVKHLEEENRRKNFIEALKSLLIEDVENEGE